MEPTQARIRELLDYRADGALIWKIATSNRVKIGFVAGFKRKDGYWFVSVDGRKHALHRLIYIYHHGAIDQEIDHRDGNPSNNRIANLRLATRTQNCCNKRKQRNNKSGVKGVFWCADRQRWIAKIKIGDKSKNLGRFKTIEEAAAAYADAAAALHGEFARTG